MDNHVALMRLLPKNAYSIVLDLRDAYYAVRIVEEDRRYLCFDYDDNRYHFNCLCFGLACAPWAFSKLLRPVVAALRQKNIMCINYLDDFCFFARSKDECSEAANQAISLLQSLGFNINYKKSILRPSQNFRFLGFQFDSCNRTISLPVDKTHKLKTAITKFMGVRSPTVRQAAKLIGLLISSVPTVPYSLVYCRRLERDRFSALLQCQNNYSGPFTLSDQARNDLVWWLQALDNPVNCFPSDSYDYEIFSDSSSTGWGGHLSPVSTGGWWNEEQLLLHINQKELLAALESLRHFASTWVDKSVLLRVDNVTAIACINRGGSVRFPHLHEVALDIWRFCEKRHLRFSASYIRSEDNIEADTESRRNIDDYEWGSF
uniref:Pol polyprotein n=2 Tax=Lygus hesperus TaxID=30085 RepID=A0A0A9XFC9_LYGHE